MRKPTFFIIFVCKFYIANLRLRSFTFNDNLKPLHAHIHFHGFINIGKRVFMRQKFFNWQTIFLRFFEDFTSLDPVFCLIGPRACYLDFLYA